MRKALLSLLESQRTPVPAVTLRGLSRRGLVTEGSNLTLAGRIAATALLPLSRQCAILQLQEFQASAPDISRPEALLRQLYQQRGFQASFCEGGAFLTLLKAAALPLLTELNPFGSREDACARKTEAQFTILRDEADRILNAVECASLTEVASHAREICHLPSVQDDYPHLGSDLIVALFDLVGPMRLRCIGELLFEDPYTYRNGWPDLTLVKQRRLYLMEVKTTDRLHTSQIRTIPRIRQLIPGTIGVIRLNRCADVELPDFSADM